MKIVAGLGNPGRRYFWSRHNIGYLAIDFIARRYGVKICHSQFHSLFTIIQVDNQELMLIKPLTLMNHCGETLRDFVNCYSLSHAADLIIIHDDLDLPWGKLKIKTSGGDGGHKGLRSIIENLGERDFLRLRIGIGRPPEGENAQDYVLQSMSRKERKQLAQLLPYIFDAAHCLVQEGVRPAMNRFNQKYSSAPDSPR